MAELKFEIISHIAILSENKKGWTKELNLVSWNEREGKFDIREWDLEHEKMSKGITLTKDEIKKLKEVSKEQIAEAFERDDLIIYTDPAEFKSFLFEKDLTNTALLFMSSGNYGGLDLEEVKGLVK